MDTLKITENDSPTGKLASLQDSGMYSALSIVAYNLVPVKPGRNTIGGSDESYSHLTWIAPASNINDNKSGTMNKIVSSLINELFQGDDKTS